MTLFCRTIVLQHVGCCLLLVGLSLICLLGSTPSYEGRLVRRIDLKSDGPLTLVTPRDVLKLSELQAGQQYKSSKAKRTIRSLYSTQVFHDVQIEVFPVDPDQVDVALAACRT